MELGVALKETQRWREQQYWRRLGTSLKYRFVGTIQPYSVRYFVRLNPDYWRTERLEDLGYSADSMCTCWDDPGSLKFPTAICLFFFFLAIVGHVDWVLLRTFTQTNATKLNTALTSPRIAEYSSLHRWPYWRDSMENTYSVHTAYMLSLKCLCHHSVLEDSS